MITELQFFIGLGLALFTIGAIGFLSRRSGLIAMMCLELMLNGVNICLVTFARHHNNTDGSVLVLFIVLVAAAEAAIALSLFVSLFRQTGSVDLDDQRLLKG